MSITVFISHRHARDEDYSNLTQRLRSAGFHFENLSVAAHRRIHSNDSNYIATTIRKRLENSDYFIIFANMATGNSQWCLWELAQAEELRLPILMVVPREYYGNLPREISARDNQGGPLTNADAIIRRIQKHFQTP